MNRLFIADKDFSREIPRNRAKGYKRVVVDDSLDIAAPFRFQTQGTDLVATPEEFVEGAGECYTILCREFGLIGLSNSGFKSKLSIIFCDNGWMLVTLRDGGIVVNLDDQLMMPMVGDSVKSNEVHKDNILWIDAEKLLGYSKHFEGNRGHFMYDYEFMLELGGDNNNGMGSISMRMLKDEDIDISLGYIGLWEQQQVKRQEANQAKKAAAAVFSRPRVEMEFDEAPVQQEETEEEEDGGIVW